MSKTFQIIGILILTLAVHATLKAQEVKWYTFTEATELNKKEPRKIIIDVFTEWCGWCKVMDKQTFHDATIAKILNEKFYPVKFDAERKDPVIFDGHTFINEGQGNRPVHQLAAALLNGKMSYPSVVFMNEKNQLITAVPGFQKPDQMEPLLIFISESLYEKGVNYQDYVKTYKSEYTHGYAPSDNKK